MCVNFYVTQMSGGRLWVKYIDRLSEWEILIMAVAKESQGVKQNNYVL